MPDATPPEQLYTAAPNGDIYEIAPDTGSATLFLDTSFDDGKGQFVDIGPVSSMARLGEKAAQLEGGPVFRQLTRPRKEPRLLDEPLTPDMIDYVLKHWTRKAGVQPEQLGEAFSSHSLRAGFITEAARAEKPEYAIAKQSRHKSAEVLRGYIRVASVFEGNAGEGLL